jgi:hypothetical protein
MKPVETTQTTVKAKIVGYELVPQDHTADDMVDLTIACYSEFLGVTPVKNDPYVWAKAWLMLYPDKTMETPLTHRFRWIPEGVWTRVADPTAFGLVDVLMGGEQPGEFRYLTGVRKHGIYYHLYYLGYR